MLYDLRAPIRTANTNLNRKKIGRVSTLVSMLAVITCFHCWPNAPAVASDAKPTKTFFGVEIDLATTTMTAIESHEKYVGIPAPLPEHDRSSYVQPWSGYCPECTLPDKKAAASMTCQTFNIKGGNLYGGIEVQGNKWMELACEEAKHAVEAGSGPFGAVLVQIDDETGNVIRYWRNHAHVVDWCDPTAHAELTVVRAACQELGVLNLGKIDKDNPHLKLPQTCQTSHCDFYASTESCPMCYTAIRRAGIRNIIFAATRFDAGAQGVGLPIDGNYQELQVPYFQLTKFGVHMYQSTVPNSLDGFNLFKRSNVTKY